MAVKIRLRRMGAKHQPFYRVVVADGRSPQGGRFIEEIGTYDPTREPAEVHIETARALAWLAKGAQPSETVKALFRRQGIGVAEASAQGEAAQ
jgi:small subunit ribosomal protein S16